MSRQREEGVPGHGVAAPHSVANEALAQVAALERAGTVAAMATLIAAKGTTPKKSGAKMCVGRDGLILGSVTIGGCVDAEVIRASEALVQRAQEGQADAATSLLELTLGDEEAWDIGLTCGGSVEVLVERMDAGDPRDPVLRAYADVRVLLEAGHAAAIVSRLDGRRDRLVVPAGGGSCTGSLGDAGIDAAAAGVARQRLAGSTSAVDQVTAEGKDVRVFIELHRPPETVVIYGAGQVAMSLATFARELGMRTVIVDGRERFATRERFPGADEILIGMPSEIAQRLPARATTYVVLVAHDYKYELPVLRHVLRSDVGYVGMLGSRKRGAAMRQLLVEEGFTDLELGRIRTPIGLDIGAKSASEIALAIMAEIVSERERRGVGREGRSVTSA